MNNQQFQLVAATRTLACVLTVVLGLSARSPVAVAEETKPVAETEIQPAQLLQPEEVAQVTSVSQLSDVQPTDWAFQALQSLVERYGCIAGYPR